MLPYTIIGTEDCFYCSQAKSLLMESYSDYEYFDLHRQPFLLTMFKASGYTTIPQIFSPSGKLIGGYEELVAHLEFNNQRSVQMNNSGVTNDPE